LPWLKEADVKILFIAKVSPRENAYVESFHGTLRDELLNREIRLSFEKACWVTDRWRLDYNHHRIHSSLDDQTPAAYEADCVLPTSVSVSNPEHSRITNPNPHTQPGAKTGEGESTINAESIRSNALSIVAEGEQFLFVFGNDLVYLLDCDLLA
jgi:hypothetical protein